MGYRVEYQSGKQVRETKKHRSCIPVLTAVSLLVFLLLVNAFWPRGAEVLQELLFPGDAAVTAAALEEFAMELRAGEELPDALATFCRTVIQNAQADTP